MLSLSEKVKVFDLIRKAKKNRIEAAKIYCKNKFSICEIVQKEKEFLVILLLHLKLQSYSYSA